VATTALVVAPKGAAGMLGSYGRALELLHVKVAYFNLDAALARHVRFGRVGRTLTSVLPVEIWIAKANRELLVEVLDTRPSLLFVGGSMPVRAGTLAQIKVARPDTKIVWAWPDTLMNLREETISAMRVCDYVACYSSQSVPLLQRLTGARVEWVPFAVDPELFPDDVTITEADRHTYGCDVSFVGNHRPEREDAILRLLDAGISVKVWAASWTKPARDPARARTYFQGAPIFGREVVKAMRCSKLCLNVIDRTNYPAANMRTFETYACGGVPLSSRCPEIEDEFRDGESAVYFDDETVADRAAALLRDPELRHRIRDRGREIALGKHTYVHRARQILDGVGLTP
jgi:glycosyltransferase involved in cell wall biosynthesis